MQLCLTTKALSKQLLQLYSLNQMCLIKCAYTHSSLRMNEHINNRMKELVCHSIIVCTHLQMYAYKMFYEYMHYLMHMFNCMDISISIQAFKIISTAFYSPYSSYIILTYSYYNLYIFRLPVNCTYQT